MKQQQILQEQRDQEQQRIALELHQQKILEEHRKIQQRQFQFQQEQLMFQREQKNLLEEQRRQEEQYRIAMVQFQQQQEELDTQAPLSMASPAVELLSPQEQSFAPVSSHVQTPFKGLTVATSSTPFSPMSPPSPELNAPPLPTPLREAQMRWSSAVSQWKVLSQSQKKQRRELSEVVNVMDEVTKVAEGAIGRGGEVKTALKFESAMDDEDIKEVAGVLEEVGLEVTEASGEKEEGGKVGASPNPNVPDEVDKSEGGASEGGASSSSKVVTRPRNPRSPEKAVAEVARLQKLIASQYRDRKLLEQQLQTVHQKLEEHDLVDRRRRGSEMALASLSEKQKLMELSEAR